MRFGWKKWNGTQHENHSGRHHRHTGCDEEQSGERDYREPDRDGTIRGALGGNSGRHGENWDDHGKNRGGHRENRGSHGGNRDSHARNRDGHDGGSRHGRDGGYLNLASEDGTHLLFIGSRSCIRHKGVQKHQLQQEGKLTFLCPDEVDWVTGAYLQMIEDSADQVVEDVQPRRLILFGGCQVELLSTDEEAIVKDLSDRHGIPVSFHRGCHLIGYGDALKHER